MELENKIMVLGLNPALQKLVLFPEFIPFEVNRAREITYTSGGKAANFAKAAMNYGVDAMVYQFCGGSAGNKYCEILRTENIPFINQITAVEPRTCSTLMDEKNAKVTEIIEPAGAVSEKEAKKLLALCLNDMPQFQGIAICGTFPPGIKAKFYAKSACQARKLGKKVLLDAYMDVIPVLKEGISILKINLSELKVLTGKRKARTAATAVFRDFPVEIIAATDGPRPANLFLRQFTNTGRSLCIQYEYSIPELNQIINPIGAGDAVSAVLFAEYLKGTPIHEAFKIALAAGSASCITHQNSVFDLGFAKKLAATEIKLTEK